jgi:hypothetical protein
VAARKTDSCNDINRNRSGKTLLLLRKLPPPKFLFLAAHNTGSAHSWLQAMVTLAFLRPLSPHIPTDLPTFVATPSIPLRREVPGLCAHLTKDHIPHKYTFTGESLCPRGNRLGPPRLLQHVSLAESPIRNEHFNAKPARSNHSHNSRFISV